MKMKLAKRFFSTVLCVALLFNIVPLTAMAATAGNPYYDRVVDANTMDNWTKYFDLDTLNTANAGGVWTDKSVFTDASAFDGKVSMLNDDENFLTALSALAANKEVVGYSTVPTDTVLVLDLSGSMENSNSESSLINAANSAIDELLEVNENNRVGVVLYSAAGQTGTSTYGQSVTRILPIDRYTTTATNGSGAPVYLNLSSGGTVSVNDSVSGTVAGADLDNTKTFGGGTYIQAGLWEAKEMFEEMDTVIGDNNWQTGDNRMPILVLMSDGAPSTGTTYYADVENSQYTTGGIFNQRTVIASNVGNGNESDLTAGNAFLTQLTASYVMSRITAHYQAVDPNVRSLFYTLGFNIGNNSVAQSVMNPDSSSLTDELWTTYAQLTTGTMSINVKNRSGGNSDVSISKNSYVTNKSYVDEYFSASGTGLADAFKSIVDEIILQSRYYPTHLEGGNPDFSGYVDFVDAVGAYMEVKDVKGILLGDTLYDGHMMASKLADTSADGLGTVENPTALGDEFIRSVKTRLGISDTADARTLVAKAFAAGQLKYVSEDEWSNYIGWYAKADGTYVDFWDETSTAAAPAGAVYAIKSYGFLGETAGSIKNSDMMYMTVQVRTDIATGAQTVLWKIPASLVPMVTYLVALEGANVDQARNVTVNVENPNDVSPIRLVFESGLRSDLNELNITRIAEGAHIAADSVTRQFWTNHFDISAPTHDEHETTTSEFTPSLENERFYYTFDSAVHKKVGNDYVLVGAGETLSATGEYYHRRYIFTEDSSTPVFLYERMSAASIGAAVWKDNFTTITGQQTGAYVVPAGTPARELQMYDEEKAVNATGSAHMVFHPYLTEQNNIHYVDMNLGNNGRLLVTPAQGIKLSKTVDIYETGTADRFSFRITAHNADGTPYSGTADSWITPLDVVPLDEATVIRFAAAGTYTVELARDQTFWLTGLPTGTTYTVEEVSHNEDYKIKSVHVNGQSTGTVADGTVAAYFIDEVDFVNTAIGEGDLVVTKQVVDASGNVVDVNDSVIFTAEVTLTNAAGAPVSGRFDASNAAGYIDVPANGKFTVTLHDGESFVVRNIPEETVYTVVETNIPNGFAFNATRSVLTGVVDATANDQALIVNTYAPTGITGASVDLAVTKAITGNRTNWLPGESYSFEVRRDGTSIGSFTIDANDGDKQYVMDLANETYQTPGTYHYTISEVPGNAGGITYDAAVRRFAVVVADADMDGDLEITAVNNEALTTVTGTYRVAAIFNNVYQPTGSATVTIDVLKKLTGDTRLNGYQFALYDGADLATADEVVRSTVTDALGKAQFTLTYAPNRATMAGTLHTYYLAEVNTGNPNITYDTALYKVEVTVKDNGDGTTTATPVITPVSGGAMEGGIPTFTNVFTPSASAYVTLTAEKTILGDRPLNAGEFTFVIEALTAGAPLPADTTAQNAANGAVVFDTIEFDTVGTYQYKVYESDANPIGGFTYDNHFYEITVVVTDNGDATLSAAVSRVVKTHPADIGMSLHPNEMMNFTNTYYADDVSVILVGNKILTGKTLQAGEFTFVFTPDDPAYPMPTNASVTNDANGTFRIDGLTFSKAGTYTYTLTEQANGDTRYTFDPSVYRITITVTDDSRGSLHADMKVTKNGLEATGLTFRNGFVPTPITYDIHAAFGGSKDLDGRPLKAGEFAFALINAINGKQIGETVQNDASGAFRFPAVTLPEAGIYHFKITELVGDEKGVSYDTSSYHIRLEVEQAVDGTLSVVDEQLHKGTVTKEEVGGVLTEVVRYNNITPNGAIVFNNHYEADPAHVTLEATKILDGRDLVDGEFKFDLHKTDSTYAYDSHTLVQDDVTLSLNADGTGTVTFMSLAFYTTGTYHYVIVEDELDEKGVTSDKTVYKVEITVTDNHAGDLVATIKVGDTAIITSTSEVVKFVNTYAATGSIIISGDKTLAGRDLVAEEFTFALYDDAGTELDTVKNDANGKFAFEAISVDAAGTYEFIVKELAGNAEHVTYDDSVYTVTVTVTDMLDGTFKMEYAYDRDGHEADGVLFENTYTEPQPEPKPEPKPEPQPESPKTGDNYTVLRLLTALAFVSGGALVGLTVLGKKKEQAEEN